MKSQTRVLKDNSDVIQTTNLKLQALGFVIKFPERILRRWLSHFSKSWQIYRY